MTWKGLWVLVEGNDDERFFSNVIAPYFGGYDAIKFWQHSEQSKKRICNFITSIDSMAHFDYLFVHDRDGGTCEQRVSCLDQKYDPLDPNKIIIVEREIESWYLGGLTKNDSKDLRINYFQNTDSVTKDHFDSIIPASFTGKVEFTLEIVSRYSVSEGKACNTTFSNFCDQFGI